MVVKDNRQSTRIRENNIKNWNIMIFFDKIKKDFTSFDL